MYSIIIFLIIIIIFLYTYNDFKKYDIKTKIFGTNKKNKIKTKKLKNNKLNNNIAKNNKSKNNKLIDNNITKNNISQKQNELLKSNLKDNKNINNEYIYTFLEISIDNKSVGKIIIKLFDKIVPKTCTNFKILCKNKKYKNTIFHRVIKNFMIQGGDYEKNDGTGGKSIYGTTFDDENFELKHDKPYMVSMANCGANTNGSQFFITTTHIPHLDGKHVVFGEVVDGIKIIKKINDVQTDHNDKPVYDIKIIDCGEI